MPAVNLAQAIGWLLASKGGGHAVAGCSSAGSGALIDLSTMRSGRADLQAGLTVVGPGATWGDVDRATQAFGLVVPG